MGLLWGKKDFTYTMELCLTMGFDTDCNCATAGSVLGMVLGAQLLPEVWTAPLNDRVLSGVDGWTRALFRTWQRVHRRSPSKNISFLRAHGFWRCVRFYTENPRAVRNFFEIFGYSKGLRYDIL